MRNLIAVLVVLLLLVIAYKYLGTNSHVAKPTTARGAEDLGPRVLAPGNAATGTVVSVIDGDSIEFRNHDGKKWEVRLYQIDAPEWRQRFGQEAASVLRNLCLDQRAEIVSRDIDSFGRTVANLTCNGTNAQRHMVQNGYAWGYRIGSDESNELIQLQDIARSERRGLWQDENPMEPERFRHPDNMRTRSN